MQREDQPVVATGLERIAARARKEAKLRFTSLAHHITRDRVWQNLCQIPSKSAPGVDGQTVVEAKESFKEWIEPMLQSMHRKGYRAPVDPAGIYPQARQTSNAAAWRTLRQRSCSATQRGPGTDRRL
jgi:hypothetical protein